MLITMAHSSPCREEAKKAGLRETEDACPEYLTSQTGTSSPEEHKKAGPQNSRATTSQQKQYNGQRIRGMQPPPPRPHGILRLSIQLLPCILLSHESCASLIRISLG